MGRSRSESCECHKCSHRRDRHRRKHKSKDKKEKSNKKDRRCSRSKCEDNYQVTKAVFPGVIMSGSNIPLRKLRTNVEALRYITPINPDEDAYNTDSAINFTLNLEETEDVRNIDHIHLDLHVRTETTQDIVFNMFLYQTVEVLTVINGEEKLIKQSQQYLYQGHKYTLEGRKWNGIEERWDRPRNLGILRATNLSDEAPLSKPQLQISMYDILGKLEVDKTIQLHVEYCVENRKRF